MPNKRKLYRNKRTGEIKAIDPTFAPYLDAWEELENPVEKPVKTNTRLDPKKTSGRVFARKPEVKPEVAPEVELEATEFDNLKEKKEE